MSSSLVIMYDVLDSMLVMENTVALDVDRDLLWGLETMWGWIGSTSTIYTRQSEISVQIMRD